MNTKSQKKHKQKQEKLKAYIINLNVTSTKHTNLIYRLLTSYGKMFICQSLFYVGQPQKWKSAKINHKTFLLWQKLSYRYSLTGFLHEAILSGRDFF